MDKATTTIHCPRCRAETTWQKNPHRPFCSRACQQVDLGRWANEDYSIAGAPAPDDNERSEF